jgi:hypothetical protein
MMRGIAACEDPRGGDVQAEVRAVPEPVCVTVTHPPRPGLPHAASRFQTSQSGTLRSTIEEKENKRKKVACAMACIRQIGPDPRTCHTASADGIANGNGQRLYAVKPTRGEFPDNSSAPWEESVKGD